MALKCARYKREGGLGDLSIKGSNVVGDLIGFPPDYRERSERHLRIKATVASLGLVGTLRLLQAKTLNKISEPESSLATYMPGRSR